jgi:hypothetical protein
MINAHRKREKFKIIE